MLHSEREDMCTSFMVFSVTYYLELHCAIKLYYVSHLLSQKVKLVVWTLYKIGIFNW